MRRALVLILGAVVFALATGALWVMAAASMTGRAALALALGESVGLPLLVAVLLFRSLRRHDSATRLGSTVVGLVGGIALATLVVIGIWFRGPLSRALRDAPSRHHLSGLTASTSRKLGAWIAPSKSPAPQRVAATRRAPDAGAGSRRAPDASVRADRPAQPADRPDAGRSEPAPPPPRPAAEPERTGRVTVCEGDISAVFAVELGSQGMGDEIVVACDDGVRALWRVEDGRVLERTRITVHAPEGLVLTMAQPRVVDADEDGRADILLGAYFSTERGGTRGGDTWWALGQQDGQFGTPVRLAGGFCSGLDLGDIDGDGHAELVIVHVGNPWSPIRPTGEIRWFEREGRRFQQRGRQELHRQPGPVWLVDVNHDGMQDAIVQHEWESDDITVLPGTARGLGPIAEGVEAPVRPGHDHAALRLDDDGHPDTVTAEGRDLVFEATSRLVLTGDEASPAADHRAYDVGGPTAPAGDPAE